MQGDYSTADLRLLQLHLGGDRNFHYLVGDSRGSAAVIDPGFEPQALADTADREHLRIQRILITHGHGDHLGGAARLAALTGATVHAGDPEVVPGALRLRDGDRLSVGELAIAAIATPGHAPDHFCFHCAGNLFTGDLLFCGKIGGTGPFFPGSSAAKEWDSLRRVLELPDATRVFPGHDYYGGTGERRCSTIGHERRLNPFLTVADFAAFCDLKENWARYKEEHGIR